MSSGGGIKIGGDLGKIAENPLASVAAGGLLGPVGAIGAVNAVGDIASGLGGVFKKPEVNNPYIAGESDLEAALKAQLSGQGTSVAEKQLQRGVDLSNRNAMAMAASQRSISPGLAAQLAMNQQGMNMTEANAQAGLMRAQEQANAQGLLAQMYASQRGNQQAANQMNQQGQMFQQQLLLNALSGAGQALAGSGMGGGSVKASGGALIKGKAKVNGDSPKNDTVPAMLSPGEIVIPRSVVKKGPDAISKFAKAILEKEGKNA